MERIYEFLKELWLEAEAEREMEEAKASAPATQKPQVLEGACYGKSGFTRS